MIYIISLLLVLILIKPLFLLFAYSICYIYCTYKKGLFINQNDLSANQPKPDIVKENRFKGLIFLYIHGFIRYSIFKTGEIPSHRIRILIYKRIFKIDLSRKVVICYGAEIRDPFKVQIGEGSIIGDKAILDGRNGIQIGKNVNMSTGVWLWTLQHDYNCTHFGLDKRKGKIIIHDRVWIGPGVIVLPGVTIGEGAVIGGGSIVTKDIPPFKLYAGIPAKEIGNRNENLEYQFDGSHIPFL